MAVITKNRIEITTIADGTKVERASKRIDWSPTQAEKGGYKHFMLKEIHEQPRAVEDTLRERIDLVNADVIAAEIGIDAELAKRITRVCFARVPATVEIGSEVRYRSPVFTPTDLVIAVSQSGETVDTLVAIKSAKAAGATVIAVANVLDSAIPRASAGAFYTHAGPEIGVASTKCFTTQLAALLMLAVYLGRRRETLPQAEARRVLDALWHVPAQMREILANEEIVHMIARKHLRARDMLFLGRGTQYPIALEGALKLKEISYIHAEGYAAGEMKHGPIALIDENMPVVVICPRDAHYEKTLSNMQEVKAREGMLIAIATKGDEDIWNLCMPEAPRELAGGRVGTYWPPPSSRGRSIPPSSEPDILEIPHGEPEILPLLTVLPLQLLAYHMADLKGTDVDQPRNLAKTVTVE